MYDFVGVNVWVLLLCLMVHTISWFDKINPKSLVRGLLDTCIGQYSVNKYLKLFSNDFHDE